MRLGKRHLEVATRWLPSVSIYGASAGVALVYFTDWRVVADFIPFYRGKFKE
ncbi:cytochrome b-c1 complex subunit 10-like [Hylaeus volcanicus]|uniref:cytochrome b-c1 complex subunit 10-like n=1 Tax=Hylaeus volcanicus TaxID=313075 RepID=UPI0023B7FD88|nr:cytochrome b-c1 complex subunit 10-like [Hylaeus volcanicus]